MQSNKVQNIEKVQSSITMIVLLVSFSMLFATLFLGYMVYRVRATVWPPMGMNDLGLVYPLVSTVIIFLSSAAYYLFENKVNSQKINDAKSYLFTSFALGLGFCASQFLVWRDLAIRGITQSSGVFGSMLYGFTWIHIAHVAMGILLLFWMAHKVRGLVQVEYRDMLRVKNVGMFWHFLGLVWLIMFLGLFVF